MSEMKEMIIDTTSKMLEKHSTKEIVNSAENGEWASELWESLAEYGMLTVAIPEELGGNGGDYDDALSILRLVGKYSAPVPIAETYLANWLLTELGENGTDDIITLSNTIEIEPVEFLENGTGWNINGKVKNVPWARFAQKVLVVGETPDGHVLTLISLERAKIIHGSNLAGEARDEVIFDNIFIKNCKMIPIQLDEFLSKLLYGGALTRIAMMAGALENILEITVSYTSERSQFGRPLNRFQAIQHHIAQLAGEAVAASVAASCATDSYANNRCSNEIAMAKIRVNEAAGKVSRIAHQALAAIGFTYEHNLHHSTRRLWSWRDEFGTEKDWEKEVTKDLLNLPENGLWSMITKVDTKKKVNI
ncbi:acyl-CoA dehydrogenase family protein [Bacillus sp. B15-48]|uniref:acyl-CoA dehydrogenase family protein n=1 Tax=Bacillus sp. B15-48 TaxID=1548601 RepID=UPI00193F9BFC|nr:acyl-CoA dehydrogenase family protein [Bacillus sp. B15-48]MBM4763019.1 hypothetical protein [Bacillus sp. B15-48]